MIHFNHISYIFRFIFIGSLLSLSSCTESIDIKTDNSKPVIVIYGTITNIPAYQEVRISSSTGYFDNNSNPKISGAKVSISSDSEEYDLQEVPSTPGLYRTNKQISGVLGKNYHLRVEVDFDQDGLNEIYEADEKMEKSIQLDSIDVSKDIKSGYTFYSLNVYAQEPASEDHYMCRYQINDSTYNKISRYIIFDDISINNQYVKGLSIWHFPDTGDKDLYSDDDVKNMTFMNAGDSIKLQMGIISKGYFKFLTQCQQEMNGEDPFFGGPLSNIDTNISNGGIGYFAVYYISEARSVVPNK